MITGSGAVMISRNGGFSLMPSADIEHPISYTYGVATMIDEPDTVLAWHRDDLLISTDRGCSWRIVTTIEGSDFPPTLTPARGGRAYAWADNREFLVRYDSRGAKRLKPPAAFMGLGVDPENGEHLRAGASDGALWESLDGGESWNPMGRLEGSVLYYRFTFDPRNLDHIVAGTVSNGAFVTRDAGRTWTNATGFSKSSANVFQLVFSPADSNTVWAMGIDADGSSNPDDSSHGRHIFLSRDGGNTFKSVIDEAPGVKLINGPTMAAHPANPNVLYFVFGTHIFDYGTDLFRYDDTSHELVLMHHGMDDINAIAFAPSDPNVMYLGVETID